jgi:hypothetical protein
MDGDLMALHVLGLKDRREGDDTRADSKEGRFDVVLVEECEKVGRVPSNERKSDTKTQ